MECKDESMKKLFDGSFRVPEYQRPYAWTEENIDDFFGDLMGFIDSGESNYLFGQIIVHTEDGVANIVDGQQRIITSTIFLCALRDIMEERDVKSKKLQISLNSAIGVEGEYNVICGSENREFFFRYIQEGEHGHEARSDSDEKIRCAYDLLRSKIESYIGIGDGASERLIGLSSKFLDGFHVVYVEAGSLSQAYTVFEAFNARGTPLEVPDLLKNHFFSILDENHAFMKENWIDMMRRISVAKGDATQFVRYHWNSCHDLTREKDLFKAVSRLSRDAAIDLLNDMFKSVDIYLEMIHPRIGGMFDSDTVGSLANLKAFKAQSFYPLIIALCNAGLRDSVPKVSGAIESMVLRNQVIGKKTANRSEVFFSRCAFDISSGRMTVGGVLSEIAANTDGDDVVGASFKTFSPTGTVGKQMLIELYACDHRETRANGGKEVHLEHILPKKSEKWDIDPEIAKAYRGRFGNMALLSGKKNMKIGNAAFDVKREAYLESEIDDTRAIGNLEKWGPEEIDERQTYLLEKVLRRWPASSGSVSDSGCLRLDDLQSS